MRGHIRAELILDIEGVLEGGFEVVLSLSEVPPRGLQEASQETPKDVPRAPEEAPREPKEVPREPLSTLLSLLSTFCSLSSL